MRILLALGGVEKGLMWIGVHRSGHKRLHGDGVVRESGGVYNRVLQQGEERWAGEAVGRVRGDAAGVGTGGYEWNGGVSGDCGVGGLATWKEGSRGLLEDGCIICDFGFLKVTKNR